MLGRLLHTAASSLNPNSYNARNPGLLESVTEEEHTRSLLFPDSSLLQHSQSHAYPLDSPPNTVPPGSFDDHGGMDLDVAKDFRIIIAQDAYGGQDPCVLFDTQSTVPGDQGRGLGIDTKSAEAARGTHSRNPSASSRLFRSPMPLLSGQPGPPPPQPVSTSSFGSMRSPPRPTHSSQQGAFCRSKLRSSALSTDELSALRLDTDAREETTALLNCMFGSTIIPYKGPSTKMHILSADPGSTMASTVTSPVTGRDADLDPRKRTPLSRGGNTTSPVHEYDRSPPVGGSKPPLKGNVLLTRTFAINLPGAESSEEINHAESTGSIVSDINGFPFPDVGPMTSGGPKPKKMKARKTPIYAVAVVLQLPVTSKNPSRPSSRHQNVSFAKHGLSVPSSYDSQKSDWTFLDSPSGLFAPALPGPDTLDDRIDFLVHHWDAMTRTLSYLEKVATKEVKDLLMHVDALSPAPQTAKREGMQKTNQRIVRLSPNALSRVGNLGHEADLAAKRISLALKIPRVVIGQDRWGIWREEARWVGRWAGGKEQNFFFFNLLTAFLGNHTEWLKSLAPSWYKRRYHMQQRSHQDTEPIISHRTVIVSSDRMAARRLVFLLSAFLPPNHKVEVVGSPMRPGTSVSKRGYSPSPPTNSLAREESLRRTMNRQRLDQRRMGYPDSSKRHERSTSQSSIDANNEEVVDKFDALERFPSSQSHRDFDVRSIRTASLPIPANDLFTRKSSAATMSTVVPNRTTPVAHFASSGNRPHHGGRSDSTDSMASANLLQTLKRSESTNLSSDGTDSHTSSRWGSLFSNMWGSRQESSTGVSDSTMPTGTRSWRSATDSPQQTVASRRKQNRLEEMAEEVGQAQLGLDAGHASDNRSPLPAPANAARSHPEKSMPEVAEAISPRTLPRKRDRSPIKLQVDEHDGVVDVDIPLPNFFSSSLDSALTSPTKDFRHSAPSLDGLGSLHSHASTHSPRDPNEGALNVSGWLQTYHEDFSLQAVLPYPQLEPEIKRSMRAEATPVTVAGTPGNENGGGPEKWITVCSTLIADANTFSIRRLRLNRRIKVGAMPFLSTLENDPQQGPLLATSGSGPSPSEAVLEEKFIEDPQMDLDGTFTDAIERLLARSGQSSKVQSRASSPSGRGCGRHGGARASDPMCHDSFMATGTVEVPRAECRRMVLGALEQVVRSVTAERHRGEVTRENEAKGDDGAPRVGLGHRSAESSLREGIRQWLEEVEEAG